VPPLPQFLNELAALAKRHGALLICDEVITGFRLRYGSIAEEMGVAPDLIMLGKIIGGGLPIGAVAGRAELMDLLAPLGPVYQAGTLSGNPISVRAGLETLRLLAQPGIYPQLEKSGARLASGLLDALRSSGETGCVNRVGSLVTMFLGRASITDADEARRSDTVKFATYFHRMLQRGIYLPPSQYEAMFLSLAHSVADIDATVNAARESLRELAAA
jgi:glutamate-1-semialdehyde 2,1-aminomutase